MIFDFVYEIFDFTYDYEFRPNIHNIFKIIKVYEHWQPVKHTLTAFMVIHTNGAEMKTE